MKANDFAIRLHNLTLGYDRHPAVHHLSADIPHGALLAVVGPNGAGKSTLLKALVGDITPIQGHFELGVERQRMAYLPQQTEIDTSFPLSVFDMVAMGLWRKLGLLGGLRRDDHTLIHTTLARVGLQGLEHRPIGSLSGGQLQRARFARLMLQDARLLLLDEPFNAIDSRTTDDLCALMLDWHREGRTIVAVLHDHARVERDFPHCLLIARELIGYGPTGEVFNEHNLALARQLSERFDEHAPVCHRTEAQADA